jgi:hypothetical protein
MQPIEMIHQHADLPNDASSETWCQELFRSNKNNVILKKAGCLGINVQVTHHNQNVHAKLC